MRLDVIRKIERKELNLFFSSPIGYLFLAAYLAATLFIFFWGEAFFARNIADVRPMFEWLPVLLIFLSSALTMRMWSEERRSGTLEFVSTMPVSTAEFVWGKFFACVILLGIALILTLPLPITVWVIANLDWGPVIAGYLAALLLGAAYIAVGLFVSARTDSQIVSLIVSCAVCGGFYLLGSDTIAGLFGGPVQEFLMSIGSGSRFDAITRGVLDIRDLYFYVSVMLSFLVLNIYSLEHERWAADGHSQRHHAWRLGSGLLVANLLLANVWLSNVNSLRLDMTQGNIYSISDATRGYLGQLREPLLIRGYFTDKTHPLLAPLVPRIKDLLREYEVAGEGRVRVEIVDPADDPEIENEANTKYGIRAVPFQIADRHQAALVNSYFDVLVVYGDEYEVLGFRDLIEVKVEGETEIDVQLKNPEFDVTRSIKKALYGFQGGSSVFANINDPVEFVGYVSAPEELPEPLTALGPDLLTALEQLAEEGGATFSFRFEDPSAGDGAVAEDIAARYGFQPMAASLFDDSRFYYYLTLQGGETVVQLPLPEDTSIEGFKRGIEEGLKRFASGLLKTVVLAAPEPVPPYMQQQGMPPVNEFSQLQSFLTADFSVTTDDLTSGVVPSEADLLVVVDPTGYTDKQVFAIDQFLMKGGTVVLSSGSFAAQPSQGGLFATRRDSGLEGWLDHHGVTIGESMVMDPQNSAFPVPVTRQVGGFSFQDLVMLDYPYFIDVRDDGLSDDSPILAGIPQITMSWASPVEVDEGSGLTASTLIESTADSWLSDDTNVMPRIDDQGMSEFEPIGEQARRALGIVAEGQFGSYFAGKESPLLTAAGEADTQGSEATDEGAAPETSEAVELGVISGIIDRSAESARLVIFGSNDFLADQSLRMIGSADGTIYGNSVQMITNLVDWALEDQSLIGIRARGNFNRTLPGFDVGQQTVIEYVNYAVALLGIFAVMFVFRTVTRSREAFQASWLSEGERA